MKLLDKMKLNFSYYELKDLDIDEEVISEILSNKEFLNGYKKEFKEFIISLKKEGIDKTIIKEHFIAIYELSKNNNASKYIDFIKKNSFENRKIKNFEIINDKNFEYLYNLSGLNIFNDNISEIIKNGYSDRLIEYLKINSNVSLEEINSKIFEDYMWNIIKPNPKIGDKSTLEIFGRNMDLLEEIINNRYFDGLKFTYENIPESRDFIENHMFGYKKESFSTKQFSMEFINSLDIDVLRNLYKSQKFSDKEQFEKIFAISSFNNNELIQDLISYNWEFDFRNLSQEELKKDILNISVQGLNKNEIVLNKYFGVSSKESYYLKLFLDSINDAKLPFEYREKYKDALELLNKIYNASEEEIRDIANALDVKNKERYIKLLKNMEIEGNQVIKEQFSKDLLEKANVNKNNAKHSVINSSNGETIDVFLLQGEPFTMLVHSVIDNPMSSNNDIAKEITQNPSLWNDVKGRNNFVSTSLISDKLISTYGGVNRDGIIFGFNNISPERVKMVSIGDAGTKRKLNADADLNMRDLMYTADINSVSLVDSIIDKTVENNNKLSQSNMIYNEVILSRRNNDKNLKPDYIVCFDEINEKSINAALQFNVPIYIIDRKYYYSFVQYKNKMYKDNNTLAIDDDYSRNLKVN